MRLHVLVDGLGWEIARDLPEFRFLEGPRSALETVLGFSSSAIPTILTGKMPEQHGIWNLYRYQPEATDFPLFRALGPLAGVLDRSRVLRKLALTANRLWTGFDGYYQAYEVPAGMLGSLAISERANLYAPGGTGDSPSVFDHWEGRGESWISASWRDGAHTDEAVLEVARRKIRRTRPDEVFVYLAGYDAFGHRHAGNRPAMEREAGRIARMLESLLDWCRGLDPSTSMDVFSDHGMLPLLGRTDLRPALARAGRVAGADAWTCLLDATMARFWWHRPEAESAVAAAFEGLPGHFLSESELRRHGLRFRGGYGDTIWLADPGVQIVPSHMAGVPLGGMHGYDPSHPLMKASFLTTRDCSRVPGAIWEIFPTLVDQSWRESSLASTARISSL